MCESIHKNANAQTFIVYIIRVKQQ